MHGVSPGYTISASRTHVATGNEPRRTPQGPHPRTRARALLIIEQPILIEVVKRALNHGMHSTRVTQHAADVESPLSKWHAHLTMIDVDLDASVIRDRLACAPSRLP